MPSTYDVVDPATMEVIGTAPEHTEVDVLDSIERAEKIAREWASSREFRRNALKELAKRIIANEERLATLLSLEQGKVFADALTEFRVGASLFEYYANLDWDESLTLPDRVDRSVAVQYKPVGLVGTITPWNFPISLLCVKLAPALASGCTVISRPSPTTPLSTLALVELASEVLPAGVLQANTSSTRAVSVALSTLSEIRKISFTGSTEVGSMIAQQSASSVKRVTLELGGNDPAIVLDDADIDVTAKGIVTSAFRNAGQVCMAVKRVYAPRNRVDELVEAISAATSAHVLGHGIDTGVTMGPMHNASQLALVHSLVSSAEEQGARVVSGGSKGCDLPGYFLEPTVIMNAQPGMGIVEEEQFGNALPIVAYDNLDDTIANINRGKFGLGASIWSPDIDRAINVGNEIEAGTVWINQHTVVELDAPFGGWKYSGLGRERGTWGLHEYLQTRTINSRPHN